MSDPGLRTGCVSAYADAKYARVKEMQITQLLCLRLLAPSATWSASHIRFTALVVLMVCLPPHRAGLCEVLVCLLQTANKSRLPLIGNYKPRQMTPLFVIFVDTQEEDLNQAERYSLRHS
jgi:hypothetical protein